MALRKISLSVGGTPYREALTWPYPDGDPGTHYLIPTYKMLLTGTEADGSAYSETLEVLRFGVHQKPATAAASVVGLKDKQSYTIRNWLPKYTVHSAQSVEIGAWHVTGNYLIHDGPDRPLQEVYATAGCIEVCGGPRGFDVFNATLIRLSGTKLTKRDEQLAEIGKAGIIVIHYEASTRPPLKLKT